MRLWYKTFEGMEKSAKKWHKKNYATEKFIDIRDKKYGQYVLEIKPKKRSK
jgi:hypothetical protein